jgi:hypothetical protein
VAAIVASDDAMELMNAFNPAAVITALAAGLLLDATLVKYPDDIAATLVLSQTLLYVPLVLKYLINLTVRMVDAAVAVVIKVV